MRSLTRSPGCAKEAQDHVRGVDLGKRGWWEGDGEEKLFGRCVNQCS